MRDVLRFGIAWIGTGGILFVILTRGVTIRATTETLEQVEDRIDMQEPNQPAGAV